MRFLDVKELVEKSYGTPSYIGCSVNSDNPDNANFYFLYDNGDNDCYCIEVFFKISKEEILKNFYTPWGRAYFPCGREENIEKLFSINPEITKKEKIGANFNIQNRDWENYCGNTYWDEGEHILYGFKDSNLSTTFYCYRNLAEKFNKFPEIVYCEKEKLENFNPFATFIYFKEDRLNNPIKINIYDNFQK